MAVEVRTNPHLQCQKLTPAEIRIEKI